MEKHTAQEGVAPDVYFPIEILSREYGGYLLLATEAASRGRTAIVGHKPSVASTMRSASRGGLLFYKTTRLPKWGDSRHALVGQDPEAGMSYQDFADFHRADPRVTFPNTPTRGQFCHGPDEHEFLTRTYPDDAHRIFLTGSPRVSLWGRDGDIFHASQAAQIRDRYGRFILFCSGRGGFSHESELARLGQDATEWDRSASAHHFFACAKHAAQSLGVPVIIRPHPYESWHAWQRLVAPVENLFLESAFSLAAWTRDACALVHLGESTSALEAVVAGIPAISTGSYPSSIMQPISYTAEDNDRLSSLLTAAYRGELPVFPSHEVREAVERKVLYPLEGAAQRILDVLDRVAPASGPSGLESSASGSRRWRALAPRLRLRSSDRSALGTYTPPHYKREPLHLTRVRRDVKSAQEILGVQGVHVTEHSENCFVLTRP